MNANESVEFPEKIQKKHSSKFLSPALLFVVVSFVGVAVFQGFKKASPVDGAVISDAQVVNAEDITTGKVLAETDEKSIANPTIEVAASENFHAAQIVIGEDLDMENEVGELKIEGVRSEVVIEKGGKNVRLVVIWKTNRPTLGEIHYGKSRIERNKKVSEEVYSSNHGAIISGLDQATTYLYTIKVHDRYGNEVESDAYAVYTGAKNVSLVDLISNAAKDVFSWAVK